MSEKGELRDYNGCRIIEQLFLLKRIRGMDLVPCNIKENKRENYIKKYILSALPKILEFVTLIFRYFRFPRNTVS